MIRTLAFALTLFALCAPALHADEPERPLFNETNLQRNQQGRPQSSESPPLFRVKHLASQHESEFDRQLRDALSSPIDAEARSAIQNRLNGTWKYVAAIQHDDIETYDERDIQLVIHNDLCGVFEEGKLSGRQPDKIRILTDSDPIAYTQASEQLQKIRFGSRVGTFLSYGLLRVDGDHLMMTSTPAHPKADFISYGIALPDFFEEVGLMNTGLRKYISYFFPDTFAPEGAKNRQLILRRVSDSTELLDRAANTKPGGEQDPLKLTQTLLEARDHEAWLKQAHLRIEARVSSLNAREELAPHMDETLQKAINNWREKHAQAEFTAPTAYQDLIEALAASPDQNVVDGIALSVNLQADKAVTRIGKEVVAVSDGDLSIYIDRQQGADTLFQRGERIPHHQFSDFRFSLERIPEKATRSYTEGLVSYPVGLSVARNSH